MEGARAAIARFCPCVLSLGNHPPTGATYPDMGRVRVIPAISASRPLGLNLGLVMEIPGYEPRQLDGGPVHRQARIDLHIKSRR